MVHLETEVLNSEMGPAAIQEHCRLDEAVDRLPKAAVQQQLSARAYHHVLKLSRAIADLAGSDHIETPTSAKLCSTGHGRTCERPLPNRQLVTLRRTWVVRFNGRHPSGKSLATN